MLLESKKALSSWKEASVSEAPENLGTFHTSPETPPARNHLHRSHSIEPISLLVSVASLVVDSTCISIVSSFSSCVQSQGVSQYKRTEDFPGGHLAYCGEWKGFLFIAVFLMIPKLSMLSSLQVPCDKKMISKYVSDSKDMVKELPKMCPQAPLLNDSVVIPFVEFRLREWKKKNKTIQGTEILCPLRMLSDALTMAKGLAMPNCTENLPQKLSKVLGELDSIVKNLITQEAGTQPPSLSEGCIEKNTTKILDIFERYRNLMQGKIYFFFKAIAATGCKKNTR